MENITNYETVPYEVFSRLLLAASSLLKSKAVALHAMEAHGGEEV
jgi:hypothetical protein